jgi:hypothetical protein
MELLNEQARHGYGFLMNLSVVTIFLACNVWAQDRAAGTLTVGMGDIAAIRQKAEAGDAAAQVSLGNSLVSQFHAVDGMPWFRKAAEQGSAEGQYQLGQMLLFGAVGIPKEQMVKPSPVEGLRFTFMAATNFHAMACRNMAKALQQGLGTSTNLVESYAWLKLSADMPPGSIVSRVEMNQLALKLTSADLKRGEELFARFMARQWQPPVVRTVPEGDSRLKLSGITVGTTPLAIINGKSFAAGESADVSISNGRLRLKCVSIEQNKVVVQLAGEEVPRTLTLHDF